MSRSTPLFVQVHRALGVRWIALRRCDGNQAVLAEALMNDDAAPDYYYTLEDGGAVRRFNGLVQLLRALDRLNRGRP